MSASRRVGSKTQVVFVGSARTVAVMPARLALFWMGSKLVVHSQVGKPTSWASVIGGAPPTAGFGGTTLARACCISTYPTFTGGGAGAPGAAGAAGGGVQYCPIAAAPASPSSAPARYGPHSTNHDP